MYPSYGVVRLSVNLIMSQLFSINRVDCADTFSGLDGASDYVSFVQLS